MDFEGFLENFEISVVLIFKVEILWLIMELGSLKVDFLGLLNIVMMGMVVEFILGGRCVLCGDDIILCCVVSEI